MRNNILKYKRYIDQLEFDLEESIIIGKVTNTGRVVIKMQGEVYADIPSSPLSDSSPEYDRPWI